MKPRKKLPRRGLMLTLNPFKPAGPSALQLNRAEEERAFIGRYLHLADSRLHGGSDGRRKRNAA